MTEAWTYIARMRQANKGHEANEVVAAIIDCPEMVNVIPKTLAKWARDGMAIERVPVEWVRKYLGTTEPYGLDRLRDVLGC